MKDKVVPILLAGGVGSRLWPVSRDNLPKQFQPLAGSVSTYQETLKLVADANIYRSPVIVTNERLGTLAKTQAEAVEQQVSIVLEPVQRDSAAAVAVAALVVEERAPGSIVLVLATDHIIWDQERFSDCVVSGIDAARSGKIVVFGLEPAEPRTNYAYIKPGQSLEGFADVASVEAFVEKPNAELALDYMRKGFLWNSGNYLFRSDIIISEFGKYAPDTLTSARNSLQKSKYDGEFIQIDKMQFESSPKKSLDVALIEHSNAVAVVTGRFRWSDIGSWDTIWTALPKDENGNVVMGTATVYDSAGCLIHSQGVHTSIIGLENIITISTPDEVLVVAKDRAQDVKQLVDKLKEKSPIK